MLSPDVARYLASAGEFLRSRPAEHSVLLTVTEAVRIGGPATFGDDQPLFGWYVPDGGPVTAGCVHTPPYPVALTAMPDPVAAALARTLAGNGRAVAGQTRIGPVYTPPEHRGRGYGGAVTTAVSLQALAAGAAEVLLYTDLANPTSNALYQRLGYRPVTDRLQLRFTA